MMERVGMVKDAIESAYKSDITAMYKVLSVEVAANRNVDSIDAAQEKFRNGLNHAKKVYDLALKAAGQNS